MAAVHEEPGGGEALFSLCLKEFDVADNQVSCLVEGDF